MRADPRTGGGGVTPIPRHVGVIMDGNGRWAAGRGLPRAEGHRRGAQAVREVVRAARELGIPALTLYAFSSENWGRPEDEVAALMALLARFLRDERDELIDRGIRLRALGDPTRLPPVVRALLGGVERATAGNRGLVLSLALSYGGRQAIVAAAQQLAREVRAGRLRPDRLDAANFQRALGTADLPPLDLVIRTSGEQRLSNFMLWEAAYAELYFTPVLWPDFGRSDLEAALVAFLRRRRRFGLSKENGPQGEATDPGQPALGRTSAVR
jgi:undecaprenyl diphosphate synthase